jgi:hypothetical protein
VDVINRVPYVEVGLHLQIRAFYRLSFLCAEACLAPPFVQGLQGRGIHDGALEGEVGGMSAIMDQNFRDRFNAASGV